MIANNTTLSVSALTRQIKEILEGSFSQLWVEGEISNFVHHTSGHMYFTLKDDEAEIRCVMFKGNNQFMRFKPKNGMKKRKLEQSRKKARTNKYMNQKFEDDF